MTITRIDHDAALIVIDMQQGILRFNSDAADRIVQATASMAQRFHETGRPVVWLHAQGLPDVRTDAGLGASAEMPEEAMILDPHLPVAEGDLDIRKRATSAFTVESLESWLRARGVTQVVITGLATGMGVLSTAFSAYDRGFHVVIPADATTDMNAARGKAVLNDILPAIAEVGTSEDVLRLA
ncbi:MAG: isochorismatase family cysteine hydrolase [Actinomycetaceae bacterium]|nr:cysteine hydrolase [Actinomycetaceae bacterium]MDY6082860.1 isochorismatase family cysteine hydrolase [Actinomycetaceae bacterium]